MSFDNFAPLPVLSDPPSKLSLINQSICHVLEDGLVASLRLPVPSVSVSRASTRHSVSTAHIFHCAWYHRWASSQYGKLWKSDEATVGTKKLRLLDIVVDAVCTVVGPLRREESHCEQRLTARSGSPRAPRVVSLGAPRQSPAPDREHRAGRPRRPAAGVESRSHCKGFARS